MDFAKKVMLFNIEERKAEAIGKLCSSLGMVCEYIAKERYNENLGMLAGLDEYKVDAGIYGGKDLDAEMLVFFNIDSEALEGFLKAYNGSGLKRVDLKAVVTPHNVTWKPFELFEELLKEHEEMHKGS